MSGIADKKDRKSRVVEGGCCGVVKYSPVGRGLDELGRRYVSGICPDDGFGKEMGRADGGEVGGGHLLDGKRKLNFG